jgi:hypothetical protein
MQIVPMVLDLLPHVKNVIDFGCGGGGWLSTFAEHGLEIQGVDGPWLEKADLLIPRDKVIIHDLTQPINLDRKFDLAMTLEVAEHIADSSADGLVASLVSLSPIVLFSAAVPHQGGTNHINEQWPEYWAEKFAKHGYKPIDCIRNQIWQNEDVAYWYAQNILLFVHEGYLANSPKLEALSKLTDAAHLSRIHPKMFLKSRESLSSPKYLMMKFVWNALPRGLRVRVLKYFAYNFWDQVSAKY